MIGLPNPFEEFYSEPDEGSDTAVASICSAPVSGAAVGNHSVSDDEVNGSLPSGESEPSVMLALASSESIALSALEQAWLAGNNASIEDCDSVSDGAVQGSLPSGEIEPAVTLAFAPSESSSCGSTTRPCPPDTCFETIGTRAITPLTEQGDVGPQETTSESASYPARGQLAAGAASLPAPAAFSIPESAVPPGRPQVTTAGVTGDHGAGFRGVSSPADFAKSKNRFDEYFDPNWFMAEIDEPPMFLNSQSKR